MSGDLLTLILNTNYYKYPAELREGDRIVRNIGFGWEELTIVKVHILSLMTVEQLAAAGIIYNPGENWDYQTYVQMRRGPDKSFTGCGIYCNFNTTFVVATQARAGDIDYGKLFIVNKGDTNEELG